MLGIEQMLSKVKIQRSPAFFLNEVVCDQIAECHEKVRGKAVERESK